MYEYGCESGSEIGGRRGASTPASAGRTPHRHSNGGMPYRPFLHLAHRLCRQEGAGGATRAGRMRTEKEPVSDARAHRQVVTLALRHLGSDSGKAVTPVELVERHRRRVRG